MSDGETSARGPRDFVAALLSGLAAAGAYFAALSLAGENWGLGYFWMLVPAGVFVVAALCDERKGRWDAGGSPLPGYLLGMALAAAALAGGTAAMVGLAPVLLAALLLGVGGWWLGRGHAAPPAEPRAGVMARVAYDLLSGAVAAAAVALTMAYLPAVRSVAYASADLGAAAFLGAFAVLGLWRRAGRLPGTPIAAALAVVAVCMVNAFSFFHYPDLVISGSAVLQTSAYLLTPGRIFPFYVLAFALGIPAGLLWSGRAPGRAGWIALVVGGALAGLIGHWSYPGPYALAVGLALAAAVVAWAGQWRGGVRGSLVLRVVTVGAGALGLVWLAVGDPHMQWAGLRTTLGNVLRRGGPAGRVVSVHQAPSGWRVGLEDGDVLAEFDDGNLAFFRQPGVPEQSRAALAMAVLGRAYAPAGQKVTEPAEPYGFMRLPERGENGYALAFGDPFALISGILNRQRAQLAPGGVLAIWLPAGNLHVDDLRRTLATVGAVFEHYDVYLEGRHAVIIAGGNGELSYARLADLFKEGPVAEEAGSSRQVLTDAGFTHPTDLLLGFVGSEKDLTGLTAGVRPWSIWRPARPPAMALDLAEPARPAAVLALAQYRMLGPDRLLERLQFDSPAQKLVALRGFGPIYADRTDRMLRDLGQTTADRRAELLQFLTGPLARLDLLAPQQKGQEVRIAAALSALGLRDLAISVLTSAIKSGKDDFDVNMELAGILESQAETGEALKHLRRAQELQPDSVPVRVHIVALLLSMGQPSEAADVLKEIVKLKPDDVPSLLELGYVYAKLQRYAEAVEMAERVLRIDPRNADAESLLVLSRPAAAAQAKAGQPPK